MSAGMQALFQAKILAARGDAQQKMEVRAPTPPARPPDRASKRPTDPFTALTPHSGVVTQEAIAMVSGSLSHARVISTSGLADPAFLGRRS